MSPDPAPSFDEWVDYCFTHGYRDFMASSEEADEARHERFVNLDPPLIARYIIRLFEEPDFVADRYTDDQIGDGVHFLFGIPSGYFHSIREDLVDPEVQIACIRSVEPMYLRLFDRVCCRRGTDPEGEYEGGVDGAVFMIWDMDCIEGAVMFEKEWPHLAQPGLQVLENILMKSRTSTCMQSALHGLGHVHHYHAQECKRIIGRFLDERRIPMWLREYALEARTGMVL